MSKNQGEKELGPECDPAAGSSGSPARTNGSKRKGASHSSAKRKRSKIANRKGNTTGGIQQRGDKRVLR